MPLDSAALQPIIAALRATRTEFECPDTWHSERDMANLVCTFFAHRLADELIHHYPQLNRARFLAACGV
jgi:hypothetical protein